MSLPDIRLSWIRLDDDRINDEYAYAIYEFAFWYQTECDHVGCYQEGQKNEIRCDATTWDAIVLDIVGRGRDYDCWCQKPITENVKNRKIDKAIDFVSNTQKLLGTTFIRIMSENLCSKRSYHLGKNSRQPLLLLQLRFAAENVHFFALFYLNFYYTKIIYTTNLGDFFFSCKLFLCQS